MDKVYDALEYLQQSTIFTHQLPLATDMSTLYIYTKYPQLINVGKTEKIRNKQDVDLFLSKKSKECGSEFELEPISIEFLKEIGILDVVTNSNDDDYVENLQQLLDKKEKEFSKIK